MHRKKLIKNGLWHSSVADASLPFGAYNRRISGYGLSPSAQIRPGGRTSCIPGRYLQILFQDNGVGMEKNVLDKIFEPFFTTKPVGKGSGMGLSVVHGIIKNHDGAVHIESQPGMGTSFWVYLPLI